MLSLIHEGVEAVPLHHEFLSLLDASNNPTHEIKIRLHRKIIQAISRLNRWEAIQRFEEVLEEHAAAELQLIEHQPPQIETIRFLTEQGESCHNVIFTASANFPQCGAHPWTLDLKATNCCASLNSLRCGRIVGRYGIQHG